MEINGSAKAYSATLNTATPANKPEVQSQVAAPADKVTLSSEALALASVSGEDEGSATVQTELPGWPPVMPTKSEPEPELPDPTATVQTELPGWPPVMPEKR